MKKKNRSVEQKSYLVSINHAAKLTGLSVDAIFQQLVSGELVAVESSNGWQWVKLPANLIRSECKSQISSLVEGESNTDDFKAIPLSEIVHPAQDRTLPASQRLHYRYGRPLVGSSFLLSLFEKCYTSHETCEAAFEQYCEDVLAKRPLALELQRLDFEVGDHFNASIDALHEAALRGEAPYKDVDATQNFEAYEQTLRSLGDAIKTWAKEKVSLIVQQLENVRQIASIAFEQADTSVWKEDRHTELQRLKEALVTLDEAIPAQLGAQLKQVRAQYEADALRWRSFENSMSAKEPLPRLPHYIPKFWALRHTISQAYVRENLEEWASEHAPVKKVRQGKRWKIYDYDVALSFDKWLLHKLINGRPSGRGRRKKKR